MRPELWATWGESQTCGVRSQRDVGCSWTPSHFFSFPPSSQCDFLGELFEEKERETIETRAFPSHAFPLFVLSPFRYSVVILTLSALISRLLRPSLLGTRCAPTFRCSSRPPVAPGFSSGPPAFSSLRRSSALLCVPLWIGPLLLGLYPWICGLCFLNEQL